MKLFNQICIETSAVCNRKCVFCPNHVNERPDEEMPWATIEKIVQELKAIGYKGRVTNYIYNEPMRDKRYLDIIRYIATELPGACIMMSTNTDYIKRPQQIEELYAAGARQVIFNIYSASDHLTGAKHAAGIAKAEARANVVQGWLDSLGLEQEKGMYDHAPRGARRGRVERKYGVQPGQKKIGAFELQNRSGKIAHFQEATSEPLAKMCVRPFRVLNINWRGDALLCCNDYHGDLELGNVNSSSILDIWNGPVMNAYRVALLAKDRAIKLCSGCDYKGGAYTHLVDRVSFGSAKKDKAAVEGIRP